MVSVKLKPVNCGERLSSPKNYNGIDLVKFICSILVFMLHSVPFSQALFSNADTLNYVVNQGICRIAVPFFFVASGFFLFKKMDLNDLKTDVIKKYCFRILQLFGLWNVLLIFSKTGHLWYLSATVVAVVIFSVLIKILRMKIRSLLFLAVFLYLVGMLGDSYRFVILPLMDVAFIKYPVKAYEYFFTTTRNGVFFGFLFITIGAILANYDIKITTNKAIAGLFVSVALMYIEIFAIRDFILNMYISLVPATFFLFLFAKNVRLKDRPIYRRLRTVSMLIYFTHWFIKDVIGIIFDQVKLKFGLDLMPFIFLISLVITLLITFFIEWLSRKEKFKWINWLL